VTDDNYESYESMLLFTM